MCTYVTETVEVTGSAKGPAGWFPARRAVVSYDHPFATAADHTLNIDVWSGDGAEQRVALELTRDAARGLVRAIEAVLEETAGTG